ncbi:hypothetical protein [Nonomuraea longicatena]|uniref:hypothetical protein n=1 Tax=Nonomuraea longicatena TaxID=83682 RepID=UPI0031D7D377
MNRAADQVIAQLDEAGEEGSAPLGASDHPAVIGTTPERPSDAQPWGVLAVALGVVWS